MSLPDIGLVWPGWRTEALLREESQFRVYSAVKESGEKAAVKILNFPRDPAVLKVAADREVDTSLLKSYFKKFKDEINWELTLFGIAESPNLIKNDAVIFRESKVYPGWSLYIRTGFYTPLKDYAGAGTANRQQAVKLGSDLCAAVIALQSKGVIHGAMDPESVAVTGSGSSVNFALTDYGVVRCLRAAGKTLFQDAYSRFTAPEILAKAKYSESTEIYSIGMLMYYLLCGGNLPESNDFSAIEKTDAPLADILKRATAAKSQDRITTAGELQRELSRLPEEEKKLPEIFKEKMFGRAKGGVETYRRREVFTEKIPEEAEVIPPIPQVPTAPTADVTGAQKLKGKLTGAMSMLGKKLPNLSFRKNTEEDESQLLLPGAEDKLAITDKKPDFSEFSEEPQKAPAGEDSAKPVPEAGMEGQKEVPASTDSEQEAPSQVPAAEMPSKDAELESIIAETKSGKYETSRKQERLLRDLEEEFPEDKKPKKRSRGWVGPVILLVILILAVAAIVYTQAWKYIPFFGDDSRAEQSASYSPGISDSADNSQKAVMIDSWDPAAENSGDTTQLSDKFTNSTPSASPDVSPNQSAAISPVDSSVSPQADVYILPTDTELISVSDIQNMTEEETYMVINEIYARHGKIFVTASIQDYFEGQSWYVPYSGDSVVIYAMFSSTEVANLATVVQYQKDMGYRKA